VYKNVLHGLSPARDASATVGGGSGALVTWTEADVAAMRRAVRLAWGGAGRTETNPIVGSVVVADGATVGTGYHRQSGVAHAEIVALDVAGAVLWSVVIGLAGWAIGESLEALIGDIRRHEALIALGLLAVSFAILAFRGRDYRGLRLLPPRSVTGSSSGRCTGSRRLYGRLDETARP